MWEAEYNEPLCAEELLKKDYVAGESNPLPRGGWGGKEQSVLRIPLAAILMAAAELHSLKRFNLSGRALGDCL